MPLFQTINPANMTRLRLFAFALFAGAVTTTVQAAERDVVGWECARWGMNEREIRDAFSSKLLVLLAGEQPGETVLSIPGYVFLGCPSDVTFRFAGARGPVRINLTEVGNLLGHHGNGIPLMGPPASSSIAGSRTCSGRGRPEAPKNPGPSLRRMSPPVAWMQEALTSPSRGMLIRSREPRNQGPSRAIRAPWIRARDWVPIFAVGTPIT
jgi:hypothetical protein